MLALQRKLLRQFRNADAKLATPYSGNIANVHSEPPVGTLSPA